MLAKPQIRLDVELLECCQNATVITASERLRDALVHAYDMHQSTLGVKTWRTAHVLTLGTYLRQQYDLLLQTSRVDTILLGTDAQRLAWLDQAPAAPDVDFDGIYDQVAQAWQIAHDWNLIGSLSQFGDNENHRLFRSWVQRYQRSARHRRWVTEAELPNLLGPAIRSRVVPVHTIVFIGFDVVAPSLELLLEAMREAGADVRLRSVGGSNERQPKVVTCEDPEQELRTAILWARNLLLDSHEPLAIGIALPDVIGRYDQILRQLDAMLRPANRNPDPSLCPYDISGGIPLTTMPVVAIALELLQWLIEPAHYSQVDALLRSPFLSLRGIHKQSLHPDLPEAFDAATLTKRLDTTTPLHTIVGRLKAKDVASVGDTIDKIRVLLGLAGWPNVANLTSESFQAYQHFTELLDSLVTAAVATRPGHFADTLAIVRSTARRSLFAPRRPRAPLQVLGYLETASLEFTHLWVIGVSDHDWPNRANPTPYIPLRLLRQVGVPRTDTETELDFAQRLTQHWRSASPQIVFSNPRLQDESIRRPSLLVGAANTLPAQLIGAADVTLGHPCLTPNATVELAVQIAPRGSPVEPNGLRHRGSEILRDQSACPFRAYARYRLGLTERVMPHSFPDANERGTLIHLALRETYDHIGHYADVDRSNEAFVASTVAAAVDVALATSRHYPRAFLETERKRLTDLVHEWLAFERARFRSRTIATEHATTLTLGELTFELRIDRIDELDGDGKLLVIDYKTGIADPLVLFGDRPEEPQLAMYALSLPNVQAIAFARIRHDDCRFSGWSNHALNLATDSASSLLPAPPPEPGRTWQLLLNSWRAQFTSLSNEFCDGIADVAPRDSKVCRQCDLHSLCRVREVGRAVSE